MVAARRRQIDKNVASLIDDFEPRSTSAPPHLEDHWAAHLVRQSTKSMLSGGTVTFAINLQLACSLGCMLHGRRQTSPGFLCLVGEGLHLAACMSICKF